METGSEDLRAIANRHWVDGFRDLVNDLGGEFRKFGSVPTFVTNLPMAFANGSLVLEPADPDDLDAAISWVEDARVPFQIRVDEPLVADFGAVLDAHKLVAEPAPMPAMVLRPIPPMPTPPAVGIAVARVVAATYPSFLEILVGTGIAEELAVRIFPRKLIASEHAAYFVASVDGQPVGMSIAVRTGESGGIYSVATLESARRRGVGTAVTWAAVDAIREWGCTAAVLQSSEMGYPVYRAMGFAEVTRYTRYLPIADDGSPLNRW